jgi:hypothetical protein
VQQLLLQGDYELKSQIDSSHSFLYGHRFWPEVKRAIEQHADNFNQTARAPLADQILESPALSQRRQNTMSRCWLASRPLDS